MKKTNWRLLASSILKSELAKRNINYEPLVKMLGKIGVEETYASIANKISRGSFDFSFFLQCAAAIGIKNLRLDEIFSDQEIGTL